MGTTYKKKQKKKQVQHKEINTFKVELSLGPDHKGLVPRNTLFYEAISHYNIMNDTNLPVN